MTVTGRPDGQDVLFEIDTGTQKRVSRADASVEAISNAVPWAAMARMKAGDQTSFVAYEELTGETKHETLVLKAVEERRVLGGMQTMYRFVMRDESGMDMDTLVTREGILLEGTLGPNIRIELEDEQTAKRTDVKLLDLYSTSFIPATGKIDGSVVRVKKLKMKLTGQTAIKLADDPRQTVVASDDRSVTVVVEACPTTRTESPSPALRAPSPTGGEGIVTPAPQAPGPAPQASPPPEATACNADIPCDLAKFKELAATITAGKTTTLDKVLALTAWVHKNMAYALGSSGGTADQILERRKGDCSEFAKLLLTLARAAGIPAREISGIAVAAEKPLSFGYHAWVEVWVEGVGWVAVDPTWGEFPVDAAHIVFDVDDGARMMVHLGGLTMEILEVEFVPDSEEFKCDWEPTSAPPAASPQPSTVP